jgi:hypothetical protein
MSLKEIERLIDLMIEKHALQVKNEGTEITLSATAFIKNFPPEKAKIKTPEQEAAEEEDLMFAATSQPGRGPI